MSMEWFPIAAIVAFALASTWLLIDGAIAEYKQRKSIRERIAAMDAAIAEERRIFNEKRDYLHIDASAQAIADHIDQQALDAFIADKARRDGGAV